MLGTGVAIIQGKGVRPRNPFAAVLLWVFFSVLIGGVLPIGSDFLISTALDKPFSLKETLSHGELLLVVVTLVSDVFQDLYTGSYLDRDGLGMVVVVGSLVVLLGSCIMFGCLAAFSIDGGNPHVSQDFVMWFSLTNFFLAIGAGAFTKWRKEL